MEPRVYLNERFCEHCNVDTSHRCRDGRGENLLADYQECLTCGWWRVWVGPYVAPWPGGTGYQGPEDY